MKNMKKGQMSFTNLIVIAIIILLYLSFVPVLITPAINGFVASEANDTNPMAPAMIAFAQAVPLLMLIAIIVGAFMIAVPRSQQGGQY